MSNTASPEEVRLLFSKSRIFAAQPPQLSGEFSGLHCRGNLTLRRLLDCAMVHRSKFHLFCCHKWSGEGTLSSLDGDLTWDRRFRTHFDFDQKREMQSF